jgi:hypothetical protein
MAIEFAEKALQVLPDDPGTSQGLKNRVKDMVTERLKRLRSP